MPVNTPATVMADLWKRQLDMAEAAGRDPRKLRLVAVANSSVTSKPVDSDRQLYQGTPDQIVEDMAGAAAAGAHEIVIALETDVASTDELVDKALMLKEAATAAGLR